MILKHEPTEHNFDTFELTFCAIFMVQNEARIISADIITQKMTIAFYIIKESVKNIKIILVHNDWPTNPWTCWETVEI